MKNNEYFKKGSVLSDYGIDNFTTKEVELTGCCISLVKIKTMLMLQKYRNLISRRINLLFNGIASGSHKYIGHEKGEAVDFYFNLNDGNVHFNLAVELMIQTGYTGIGVYYCDQTKIFTFHVDTRPHPKLWCGRKKTIKNDWCYYSLLSSPLEKAGY